MVDRADFFLAATAAKESLLVRDRVTRVNLNKKLWKQ